MKKTLDYVKSYIYEPFRGESKFEPVEAEKAVISSMYRRILTELAINRFTWNNLPKEIDRRFLESTLYYQALCVFFHDENYDRYMCLKATGSGNPNMYDNPTTFTVFGNTYLQKTLTARECVPIWANTQRQPDTDIVRIYSNRLAEIDTSLDILRLTSRMPFIISTDKEESLSMANLIRQIRKGVPAVFGSRSISPSALADRVSVFSTGIPDKALPNLWEDKIKTWNEVLTLLGIMNVNSEKRERMVAEEASGSAGHVLAARSVALNSRQYAAEQINRMFGLDVSVEWSLDQPGNMYLPNMATSLEGLNPNGDSYN